MNPLHRYRDLVERWSAFRGTLGFDAGAVTVSSAGSAGTAVVVRADAARQDVDREDLEDVEVAAAEVLAAVAEDRRSRVRNRPPARQRRLLLYLALVGLGVVSGLVDGAVQAEPTQTVTASVSVAEELGIGGGTPIVITEADAGARLGDLAASRMQREAEQAAAAQVQADADRLAAEQAAAAAAEAARPNAILPVQGARLTSGFGARWGTLHPGIDLAAPMLTPEYAVMDGIVLQAGAASGYGQAIYIQHENGDVTVYGHMEKVLVEVGQAVQAGETIALLGNRGQSTGPHLHFEVHLGGVGGQKTDPLPWLRDLGLSI